MTVAQVRKAIVASLAALVILVASVPEIFGDWLSAQTVSWIASVASVLGAIGVYLVRNAPIIDKIGTGAYRRGDETPGPTGPAGPPPVVR